MKAIAFVDYENVWRGFAEKGKKLRPEEFVQALQGYAQYIQVDLLGVYLYTNFDKEEFWKTQTAFEMKGINTRHSYGKNSFSNTETRQNAADQELMLEALEILLTRPAEIDLVLLFTGDGDFFPLVRRIRTWGKQVKVLGVNKVNHLLQPYSEDFDIFCKFIEDGTRYDPSPDIEDGIKILGELQVKMPYVASTRARTTMSKKMGRTLTEIKELIEKLLELDIIKEKEHYDANLQISKTKIYLLNTDNPLVKEYLELDLEVIRQRNTILLQS